MDKVFSVVCSSASCALQTKEDVYARKESIK